MLPGLIIDNPRQVSWYSPVKLGYSVGYSVVMCLLVFGTLGCFQALCSAHSPVWRYVSDSAYWIYLAHIVVVPFLQVWMGDWNWPGLLKFALLNATAFVLLFATYHYLVRSTIIGQVLNGQRYPFTWLPWKTAAGQELVGAETAGVILSLDPTNITSTVPRRQNEYGQTLRCRLCVPGWHCDRSAASDGGCSHCWPLAGAYPQGPDQDGRIREDRRMADIRSDL
jgi:hypothetical protein